MKTVETLFAEIAAMKVNGSPLLVNNLFQSQAFNAGKRDWQANLRTALPDCSFFEFGRGETPGEALQTAIEKTKNTVSNNMPAFLPKAHVKVKAVSVEDLF